MMAPVSCVQFAAGRYFRRLISTNSYLRICTKESLSCVNVNESQITSSERVNVVFSGIQPTGSLHIGNYFGAVSKWREMQQNDNVILSIVDMHSVTLPHNPTEMRDNIMKMIASLLACGIDPEKCILFQQSAVSQHTELAWILSCLTTMARLGHLPQYKEKSAKIKEIPLGLFIYPVLQCADILLYKATHVPVGEDQVQHVQLAQHLAKLFNNKYGSFFPTPHALLGSERSARIKSLRDPLKKMSKSDPDPRSRIELTDTPVQIEEKLKKAVTDFTSEVFYEPHTRLGVSNLIDIHCLFTDLTPDQVRDEAVGMETAQYKLKLADIISESLASKRQTINRLLEHPEYLESVLKDGADKAKAIASSTWNDVKKLVGFL